MRLRNSRALQAELTLLLPLFFFLHYGSAEDSRLIGGIIFGYAGKHDLWYG